MPDFSKRSADIETMDNLHCEGKVVEQTLKELENINYLLGGNYVTLDGIDKLINDRNRTYSIVDVGCGSGDILRLIYKWAAKKKLNVRLTGIDANPFIIQFAKEHTPEDWNIQFKTQDILTKEFQTQPYDILVGTLFFHHFTDEELVDFFIHAKKQARVGIVINDIHRHPFAYHAIRWLTKLFSKSAMVRNDAPVSVIRAFTKKELITILQNAGINQYSIRWMWAFRWQIIIRTT